MKTNHLIICFLLLCLAEVCEGQVDNKSQIIKIFKMYTAAENALTKRDICIEAIDEGLIKNGESVEIVDELFGTKFAKDFMTDEETEDTGVVYFSKQHKQDGINQIAPVGWYFYVTWDKTRRIKDYGLTNIHK